MDIVCIYGGLCVLGVMPCRGLFVWYGYSDLCILGYGLLCAWGSVCIECIPQKYGCVYRLVEVGIACVQGPCIVWGLTISALAVVPVPSQGSGAFRPHSLPFPSH